MNPLFRIIDDHAQANREPEMALLRCFMALMGTVDARCVAAVLEWKEINGPATYHKVRVWATWRAADAQNVMNLAKAYKREKEEAGSPILKLV